MPPKRKEVRNPSPPVPSSPSLSPLEIDFTEQESTVQSRQGRGTTRGVTLEKYRKVGKIKVNIPDEHTGGEGQPAAWLASHVGALTRTYAPLATTSWKKVPQDVKELIKKRCLDDFELNFGRREERKTVEELMGNAFRKYKARCHEYYNKFEKKEDARQHPFQDVRPSEWEKLCDMFEDPSYQERSSINKTNRSKLKINHHAGSRSFHRLSKKLQDSDTNYDLTKLYAASHTDRNGEWTHPDAHENYDKMIALRAESASDQNSSTSDIEIFTQVLGQRSGYLRGLGRCVKPGPSSSSSGNASMTSIALENANSRIEELTARQHELEAQLAKQADMEMRLKQHEEQQEEFRRQMQLQMQQLMQQYRPPSN